MLLASFGHTTVQRVWKEHRLKPHLSRPFEETGKRTLSATVFAEITSARA
jgi:hypothetical protein